MKIILFAAPVLAVTLGSTAYANTAAPKVSAADQTFFKTAAISGMTEVEAGKIAADKGSTDNVKAFGQKMVVDHTQANDQLQTLAAQKGVTLPAAPDAKHQAMLTALKAKSGTAFDMTFEKDMEMGHAAAIATFTKASHSKDADISRFATETLPTLKEHQMTIPGNTKVSSN